MKRKKKLIIILLSAAAAVAAGLAVFAAYGAQRLDALRGMSFDDMLIFAEWYNEANNDEDPNTCLLRIRLTKGVWNDAHKGIRDEIDFVNQKA